MMRLDYTLERDNRELQQSRCCCVLHRNYTLERDNRELQPMVLIIAM